MKEINNQEIEKKVKYIKNEKAVLQISKKVRKHSIHNKKLETSGGDSAVEFFPKKEKQKPNIEIGQKNEQEIRPIPTIYFERNNNILKLKNKTFIGILILLILAFIAIMIYLFWPKLHLDPEPKKDKESFVTGLTYKENQVMKFRNIKITKVNFDFENVTTTNSTKTIKEYSDYVIGIIKSDKVIENNTEKEIFEGFIFLENYLLDNETNKMLLQNSTIFDDILKKNNLRNLQEIEKKYFNFSLDEIESHGCIDNGTLPIILL